jgi:hypothetical protein
VAAIRRLLPGLEIEVDGPEAILEAIERMRRRMEQAEARLDEEQAARLQERESIGSLELRLHASLAREAERDVELRRAEDQLERHRDAAAAVERLAGELEGLRDEAGRWRGERCDLERKLHLAESVGRSLEQQAGAWAAERRALVEGAQREAESLRTRLAAEYEAARRDLESARSRSEEDRDRLTRELEARVCGLAELARDRDGLLQRVATLTTERAELRGLLESRVEQIELLGGQLEKLQRSAAREAEAHRRAGLAGADDLDAARRREEELSGTVAALTSELDASRSEKAELRVQLDELSDAHRRELAEVRATHESQRREWEAKHEVMRPRLEPEPRRQGAELERSDSGEERGGEEDPMASPPLGVGIEPAVRSGADGPGSRSGLAVDAAIERLAPVGHSPEPPLESNGATVSLRLPGEYTGVGTSPAPTDTREIERRHAELDRLLTQGRIPEAIEVAQRLVEATRSHPGESTPLHALLLVKQGELLYHHQEGREGAALFDRAEEILRGLGAESSPVFIKCLFNKAMVLGSSGELAAARSCLGEARSLADVHLEFSHPLRVMIREARMTLEFGARSQDPFGGVQIASADL